MSILEIRSVEGVLSIVFCVQDDAPADRESIGVRAQLVGFEEEAGEDGRDGEVLAIGEMDNLGRHGSLLTFPSFRPAYLLGRLYLTWCLVVVVGRRDAVLDGGVTRLSRTLFDSRGFGASVSPRNGT